MAFGLKSLSRSPMDLFNKSKLELLPVRVLKVILDSQTYPEEYAAFGEEAAIGGILFQPVNRPTAGKGLNYNYFALPLLPNISHYPVENEIVLIVAAPNPGASIDTYTFSYYYLPPVNTWSQNHHNAIPDQVYSTLGTEPSQRKSFDQIELGSPNNTPTQNQPLTFGNGFKERNTVQRLAPYGGDILYEGRWGNTLRLGSTNRSSSFPNPWSSVGNEGDAITILRNGQYTPQDLDPTKLTVEDVNRDDSSIYLTSTQKIPIETPKYQQDSYKNNSDENKGAIPTTPSNYAGNQVILTSGRLLFTAKTDSVILTSPYSIHLSSPSVNIDSNLVSVVSNEVRLGDSNKNLLQGVAKGRSTVETLDDIIQVLKDLTAACQLASNGGGAVPSLVNFASANRAVVDSLTTNGIESDEVFTT